MGNIEITYNTILQLFGALAVVGGGVKIIISAFSPYKSIKDHLKKHDKQFESDYNRIGGMETMLKHIEESQKLQGKALMELLNHTITGNDIEKLETQYNNLVEFYINNH